MQISDTEVKRLLKSKGRGKDGKAALQPPIDDKLMEAVTAEVLAMSDREERIAQLKRQINAGMMPGTGEEIVESMIRRSIADKIGD